jgi:hypothetical protein
MFQIQPTADQVKSYSSFWEEISVLHKLGFIYWSGYCFGWRAWKIKPSCFMANNSEFMKNFPSPQTDKFQVLILKDLGKKQLLGALNVVTAN